MKPILTTLFALSLTTALAQNTSRDYVFSEMLVPGEDWQLVGEGYGFTDGACSDAQGNFYFADLPKGVLHRVTTEGKVSAFLENGPRISGLKFGPDGKLYAATQGPKKQIITVAPETKEISVLADEVTPNDLAVSHKGHVYFTDTGKGRVMSIDPQKKLSVAAEGINAPNGITLSPDQRSLAVSEYKGTNVWLFRVGPDGGLSNGSRAMELRTPAGRADSGGDGSTTDTQGRYYVTSHLGIQVFDAAGRLSGVIPKPTNKSCVSVAFAGPDHAWLYACASDKVFRRKTQAKGARFFLPPKH